MMSTIVNELHTSPERTARGQGVGQVAFLFGLAGRTELPGTALRRMLGDVGHSPDAARTLLARMVRAGQLSSHRQGRTTAYALAGPFLAAWERVRDQAMTRSVGWPGHFHAVLHAVPEEHRAFRDQLRRAAVLSGYGVLQPGVLIALTDRSAALAVVLADVPPTARVRLTTLGMSREDAADAAAVAWDLDGLAGRFREHVTRLDALDHDRPDAFRAYVDTLQPALTDTLREPALEPSLLPPEWPGPGLRAALGRAGARHRAVVDAYLDGVLGTPG